MEVKRICQWCGKPFIAQKTTTCYCSPQCSKRGYKHRIKERKMELRHMQEMQELRSSLEKQEYFTFSQAARLMGVSRQYIYKLVKEDKLRASRLSGRMALVRRTDIELMLKSKPYERLVAKTISTSPSITLPKRLPKNIRSTPNGCGLIHGSTKSRKCASASSTITARNISMLLLPNTRWIPT